VIVSQLTHRRVGKALGVLMYRRAGQRLLRLFAGLPGISRVFLKGSSLTRCQPGLSDLDFLLCYDPCQLKPLLEVLRSAYVKQKRKVPLLGEIKLIADPTWRRDAVGGHFESIDFSTAFPFDPMNSLWRMQTVDPSPSPRQRFRYAFVLYARAISTLNGVRGERYRTVRALRDFVKVVEFLEGRSFSASTSSLFEFFARAFFALEKAAAQAEFVAAGPRLEWIGGRGPRDLQERKMWKRHAVRRYMALAKGRLEFFAVPVGGVVGVGETLDFSSLVSFLEQLFAIARGGSDRALPCWILLGPQGLRRYYEGLAARDGEEQDAILSVLPNQFSRTDCDSLEIAHYQALALREAHLRHRVMGDLLEDDLLSARRLFRELVITVLSLRTRRFTMNSRKVVDVSRQAFPGLAGILDRLSLDKTAEPRARYLAMAAEVLSECETWDD
jgi:hypothetical protein